MLLRTKSIILKRRLSVNNLNNHNEPINVTESVESTNERPVFYDEPILYESVLDENRLVESPTNRSQTTFDEDLLAKNTIALFGNQSEIIDSHMVPLTPHNSQRSWYSQW